MQKIDINAVLRSPCGCFACNEHRQAGHVACDVPTREALKLEARGMIARHYEDGAWRWFRIDRARRKN